MYEDAIDLDTKTPRSVTNTYTKEGSRLFRSACSGGKPCLILPHDPDDHALHLHLVWIDHQRLHRRVGRLEAHAAVLAVELFQRDIEPAKQRDHHLAIVGGLAILDDDEVAVADLLVDHRVALDAKHVGVALAGQRLRHGDRLVARDRLDRCARGHKSKKPD